MTSPSEPRSGTTPAASPHDPETEPGPAGGSAPAEPAAAPAGPRPGEGEGEAGEADAEASAEGGEADAEASAEGGEAPAKPKRRRKRKKRRDEAAEAEAAGEGEAAGAEAAGEGEADGAEAAAAAAAAKPAPKPSGGALAELREAYLRVDRRLLGLFRIYFGGALLIDVLRRVPDAAFFYSSSGALSNHYALFNPLIRPYFSIYTAFSTTGEVRFAFFATAAVYLLYLVGYRTKLMQVLSFFLYAQLNARNTFVENGGTVVFALLAFWTMFLPLGDRFSVDALRRSLRARREHAPEALNERGAFRAPREHFYSLAILAVTVQIAAIYFFNTVHKTGYTWRHGESIHWVLWQNRIATHLAAWLRMHEPSWLSPVLTKATLIIEGAAPVLVFSPVAQRYLRTLHVALTVGLHAGIALLMTLGPFSYVMIGLNALLLPPELFDGAAARWAARKPRLLVAYDPRDPALHQLARLLARLDSLDRLRFVSADAAPGELPEGGRFFARPEAGGPWSADADALVACLTALPLGSLARLAPARALAERYFAGRDELARSLALRPGRPASAEGPAAELAPGPTPARARLQKNAARLREAAVALGLLASLIQISRDNGWVQKHAPKLRFEQPEPLEQALLYHRLLQGWRMFSPDAPKDDGTIVVDAVTIDGRHIDPLNGGAPDFEAPLHGPWFQSQLWCDYYLRISWDNNSNYREELKRYLLNWHKIENRPANDRIQSFEVWWVSNDSPPPGQTVPFNINKRLVLSGRS
ncbi:MAG TPA: HTTM domain-containing protein [Polyangiaceae bacterium]|nr:HTTM domain-containing protein [Polyangiaceae bacterium]